MMYQSEFKFDEKPLKDKRLPDQSREVLITLMAQIINTIVLQQKGENNEQGSNSPSKNKR
jgi:hypothetical protein